MIRALMLTGNCYPHIGGIEHISRVLAKVMSQNGILFQVLCFNEEARGGELVCHRGETVQKVIDGVTVTYCSCFAMGRYVPYKRLIYLIKASKLLDVRFLIHLGGQGPLTESL